MRLFSFIKDQGKFIVFYIILMTFVSIILVLTEDKVQTKNNMIYVNIIGLVAVVIYLGVVYFHDKQFYNELKEVSESNTEGIYDLNIKPRTQQQKLYLTIIKSLQKSNLRNIQRLKEERKDQQDFILTWIHEVKLPIAASRLIIENSDGKTVDYLMDKWEDELTRIDNYIEQALYYTRVDSFSNDYLITEVELNQMIKDCMKKQAKIFIHKHINVQLFEERQYCNSDIKWLAYILDQIVSNSLKYTLEGGSVRFEYEEDQKEKRLLVIDNGVGIAEEDIGRVFDKGFTGAVGRKFSKSTGMGLYLAKQMAVKLGHDLSILSKEGEYTKVIIHFPKVRNYYDI